MIFQNLFKGIFRKRLRRLFLEIPFSMNPVTDSSMILNLMSKEEGFGPNQLFNLDGLNFISQWEKVYNTGYVASQSIQTAKPLYVPNSNLNNFAAVRFDGSSDYLSAGDLNIGNQDFNFFLIFSPNDSLPGYEWLLGDEFGSNGGFILMTDGLKLVTFDGVIKETVDVLTVQQLNFIEGIYNNSTTNFRLLVNDIEVMNTNITGGFVNVSGIPFQIGQFSQAGRFLNGDFGEITFYNRILSTDERLSVKNYFTNKWQFSLN